MRKIIFWIMLSSVIYFMAGCGQSGKLYLPDDPYYIKKHPKAPT